MYHINPKTGAVGHCRAEKDNCPFGGVGEHFESAAGARANFEKKMSSRPLDRSTLKSLTSDELRNVLIEEAVEVGLDRAIIAKAARFAKELHLGQFRSAPPWEERPPYIVHPLRNAIRTIRWGSRDRTAVLSAILHDVVEDSAEKYCDNHAIAYADPHAARDILLSRIRKDYGAHVANAVLKLSNPHQEPEDRAKMTEEERVNDYVDHVRESIANDSTVLLVKLSDLHDNAAGLIHVAFPGREKQTRKQANKYIKTMPVFREELERNPLGDPVLRRSALQSIVLIEDRLNAILGNGQL